MMRLQLYFLVLWVADIWGPGQAHAARRAALQDFLAACIDRRLQPAPATAVSLLLGRRTLAGARAESTVVVTARGTDPASEAHGLLPWKRRRSELRIEYPQINLSEAGCAH